MKTDFPMVRAMPFYLIIQSTLMLSTILEFPVYMLAYQAAYILVTPWVVLWLFLTSAGLVLGISALTRRIWKQNLETTQRLKLAGGYLLGALAGFVALGIRFFPVAPRLYFIFVGAFALVLALAFAINKARSMRQGEWFP